VHNLGVFSNIQLGEKYFGGYTMTEKEKMLAGEIYKSHDRELVKMRFDARILTERINKTSIEELEKRKDLIKELFGTTGEEIYIEPAFNCDYGCNIHVGNGFYANYNCVILDGAEVRIGENCLIGPQVGIYTATHPTNAKERNSGKEYAKSIRIGDNCWIGGNSTINPGVTLGDNVIVASGSVVTKSFGDDVIIGGNPAKILKEIDK
jgi:maltose O-acetyltransferase